MPSIQPFLRLVQTATVLAVTALAAYTGSQIGWDPPAGCYVDYAGEVACNPTGYVPFGSDGMPVLPFSGASLIVLLIMGCGGCLGKKPSSAFLVGDAIHVVLWTAAAIIATCMHDEEVLLFEEVTTGLAWFAWVLFFGSFVYDIKTRRKRRPRDLEAPPEDDDQGESMSQEGADLGAQMAFPAPVMFEPAPPEPMEHAPQEAVWVSPHRPAVAFFLRAPHAKA